MAYTKKTILGSTVALTLCPAQKGNFEGEWEQDENHRAIFHPISGLFIVEEFQPYEPSAYSWDTGWILCRKDGDGKTSYFVSDDDLWAQVNPQSYGRNLVVERDMELAAERDWQ